MCAVFLACFLAGQTATLHGRITDESGAVVPGAQITVTGPSGLAQSTASLGDGAWSIQGLPPGVYVVRASAPDLALPQPLTVDLKPGSHTLNLLLKVAVVSRRVTVEENAGPAVTTDPASNAGATVLRGEDLQALADNPEDLQSDLQALAGPSAGPNGGAIYIDGFSGGQLPSKNSIREIRINQNPFSAEYDKLGFGRIEVFTKPGTEKFHGTGFYNFGDSVWNSRDPYAQEKAPFLLKEYGGNISGPIGGRASFFLDIQRHSIDNGAIIHAVTLDPRTLDVVDPFTDVFRTPQRRVILSPRVDWRISANHTLSFRYGFTRADIRGAGIGGLNLASRGEHAQTSSHTAQISETAVLGTRAINEMRFQFFRIEGSAIANDPGPAIQVLGSFNGGGSRTGHAFNAQNNYEFQNYTSIAHAAHAWRFGVRARAATVDDMSPQNFTGTFIFGGGPGMDSMERYRRTLLFQRQGLPPSQIRALGGGATQFSIATGAPGISASQIDIGAFAGDDWRVRPNLTLSLGLRYEIQTNIHDWRDFAPRLGLAWAPTGKTVIRAGFGMFYDRFALSNTLAALRYNGVVQRQYVISDPDFFPAVPPLASLMSLASSSVTQQISSTLRAPYIMQSALGVERQLPWNTTIAITWANAHGLHQLRSTVADLPDPIFLMESSGLYNQNQWIANVSSKINRDISLFGYYVFNRAMSNTDGLATFPANPYDYRGEYGPAATDIRHRVTLGGSINLRWNFRLSPLLIASTGPPFDITAGRDVYGDTLFNARPGIATDPSRPGLIPTAYGLLDPNPGPDEEILPRNAGRGPGSVAFNLRIGKTFAFGPPREGGGVASTLPGGGERRPGGLFAGGGSQGGTASPASRRYNLSISLAIRNILNHTNPGPIIGDITSPLFGRANQSAGATSLGGTNFLESANNRRLELQTRFTF